MEAAERIRRALHDADLAERQEVSGWLAGQPDEALAGLLPLLTAGLREGAPLVQRRAAGLLGVLGPRAAAAVPELLAALASRRWTVREAVAEALGQVGAGAEEVRQALARAALHDRNALVREAAAVGLGRLGADAARKALAPGLRH